MNKSSFKLFIKNYSIHNLNDIVTMMRVMASFAGGKHLTHRQIETALKIFSKQSADVIMKARVNIGTFNAIMNENFGVNENAVEAYLKQRMEDEMQINPPTHEGYTERCNHTQSEGAYDE